MRGCSRCAWENSIRVRSLGEITRVFGVVHARADPRLDVHPLLPCVIAVRGAARQHRYCSPAIISAVDPWTDRSRRTASASHPTSSSRCAARPPPPPSSTRPPPLDGDIQQVNEPSLGVSPCPSYPTRGAPCLERGPRADARPPGLFSLFRCEFHRPDARVGVRSTLDHTIALQEVEAARQRCLVDGQRVLELLQVRLAYAPDGRENAELSYPQTARPQDVVVELRHRASDHPERVADTGRQPSEVLSSWQPDAVSSHGRHPTQPPPYQASTSYVDTS